LWRVVRSARTKKETELKLENSFDVPIGIAETWAALIDIERIIPCMPGAALTEVVDESTYKGTVSIRLGPVALTFNGTAKIEEADASVYRALVKTKGSDTKGRGNVAADVAFFLQPRGDATNVQIETDLRLSGTVAQYGRGAGMISDVASHWVDQFARCLHTMLSEQASSSQDEARPTSSEPMPVLGLGLKVLWNALMRFFRRTFGRR
jgi:carbon monoxide dehydrogenase subunit G